MFHYSFEETILLNFKKKLQKKRDEEKRGGEKRT